MVESMKNSLRVHHSLRGKDVDSFGGDDGLKVTWVLLFLLVTSATLLVTSALLVVTKKLLELR